MKKMQDKKAQTGETLTWFIATLIIVFILGIAIFVTNFVISNSGSINTKNSNLVLTKSLTAYLLTDTGSGKIYDQLKNEDNLNSLNGLLAESIFKELYGGVWFGIYDKKSFREITNDYFGEVPPYSPDYIGGGGDSIFKSTIMEEIYLNENKTARIIWEN